MGGSRAGGRASAGSGGGRCGRSVIKSPKLETQRGAWAGEEHGHASGKASEATQDAKRKQSNNSPYCARGRARKVADSNHTVGSLVVVAGQPDHQGHHAQPQSGDGRGSVARGGGGGGVSL